MHCSGLQIILYLRESWLEFDKMVLAQVVMNDAGKKPRPCAILRQNDSGSLVIFLKAKQPKLRAPKRGNNNS